MELRLKRWVDSKQFKKYKMKRQHRLHVEAGGNETNLMAPDNVELPISTTYSFTPSCNLYSEFPSF